MSYARDDLTLKLQKTPINTQLFSLLIRADQAFSHDIGDPLHIPLYSINETEIIFQICGISTLYYMRECLDWLEISSHQKIQFNKWLEKICREFLSQYKIPESVMLIELKSFKWYVKADKLCDWNMGEYIDNSKNPHKVPEKYKHSSRDAAWFIMKNIGGAILDTDELVYLSIWHEIKSIDKMEYIQI